MELSSAAPTCNGRHFACAALVAALIVVGLCAISTRSEWVFSGIANTIGLAGSDGEGLGQSTEPPHGEPWMGADKLKVAEQSRTSTGAVKPQDHHREYSMGTVEPQVGKHDSGTFSVCIDSQKIFAMIEKSRFKAQRTTGNQTSKPWWDLSMLPKVAGGQKRKMALDLLQGRKSTCNNKVCTDEPVRCPQGASRWSDEELRAAVPEFAEVFARRPSQRGGNSGGGGVNANFALWFTTRSIQPKYIIESGVWRGQTGWIMRQAAPNAIMFSVDPHEVSFLGWKERGRKHHYFMGRRFQDFAKIDWDAWIPREDRMNTLVMLDDHQSATVRVRDALRHGFVHLWYDDNWKFHSTYSFNQLCSALPPGLTGVPYKDKFGMVKSVISREDHERNVEWLIARMEIYFEFPAVFDGCPKKGFWRSLYDEVDLRRLGLPTVEEETNSYLHLYTPYVKLRTNLTLALPKLEHCLDLKRNLRGEWNCARINAS